MQIKITNTRISRNVRNNIKSMIEFACKYYLPRQVVNEVNVVVNINLGFENKGQCGPEEYWDGYKDPRDFIMNLNSDDILLDEEEFYRTVMHECVHLKQYALNEMYDCNKSVVYKGKRFPRKDKTPADYFLKPWEIEAYGSEIGLLRQWEHFNKYSEDLEFIEKYQTIEGR